MPKRKKSNTNDGGKRSNLSDATEVFLKERKNKKSFRLKLAILQTKLIGLYLRLVLGKRTVIYRAHIIGEILINNNSASWIYNNRLDLIKYNVLDSIKYQSREGEKHAKS